MNLVDMQMMSCMCKKTKQNNFYTRFDLHLKLWEEKLVSMQDILDAMLKCQATWLYLEPIFSSEDIIAQMPEEGRKFRIVDGYWKNIITEAVSCPLSCLGLLGLDLLVLDLLGMDMLGLDLLMLELLGLDFLMLDLLGLDLLGLSKSLLFMQVKDKRVLVATGQDKMLERLLESNILLDDIQKGLNTYLEKKRLYFPRFTAPFTSRHRPVSTDISCDTRFVSSATVTFSLGSSSCPTTSCWRSCHRPRTRCACSPTSRSALRASPSWISPRTWPSPA